MVASGDQPLTQGPISASYDVLGRLLAALRGTGLDNGLDFWLDGRGLVLEWTAGPTAAEARQVLMSLLIDSGNRDLRATDLVLDPAVSIDHQDENRLLLRVLGVEVELVGRAPIGWHATLDKLATQLRGPTTGPAAPASDDVEDT